MCRAALSSFGRIWSECRHQGLRCALCRRRGNGYGCRSTSLRTYMADFRPTGLLYRALQEALANAKKHSHASHVGVNLMFTDANVVLSVIDDGQGFSVPERLGGLVKANHFGLAGMEQRLSSLGGVLEVVSKPSHGTRVNARLPKQPMASSTLVVERRNGWNHSIQTS